MQVSQLCALRLVVRTSGFHPGNRGSIPLGRTKCTVAQLSWESTCLTSRGSLVRAQQRPPLFFGGVAQLVRALACHARGRGFEPRHSRQQFNICAALAHLVEQLTCNQQVVGSNPTSGTINIISGEVPERPKGSDCKSDGYAFEGSNPSLTTIFFKKILKIYSYNSEEA